MSAPIRAHVRVLTFGPPQGPLVALSDRLAECSVHHRHVGGIEDLLDCRDGRFVDVLLIDGEFEPALTFYRQIRGMPKVRDLPIALVGQDEVDMLAGATLAHGADGVFRMPASVEAIGARINLLAGLGQLRLELRRRREALTAFQAADAQPHKSRRGPGERDLAAILVIGEAAHTQWDVRTALEGWTKIDYAETLVQACSYAQVRRFDLAIVVGDCPTAELHDVPAALARLDARIDAPLLCVERRSGSIEGASVPPAGFVDVLPSGGRPNAIRLVLLAWFRHQQLRNHLRSIAPSPPDVPIKDPVTGLFTQSFFLHLVGCHHTACPDEPGALAVLAVANFPMITDQHGHAEGERIMRRLAHRLERIIRSEDLLARGGPAALALLIRQVDAVGANFVCDRLARALALEADLIAREGLLKPVIAVETAPLAIDDDSRALLDRLMARAGRSVSRQTA
ncbi:MAG: GGDEF domain-containing protein [Geminicoccaceae bacterium]